MEKFENRVFGCVVVKAINSNYNADFSGQPRTLPNGVVYATDKALKYTIRNYVRTINPTLNIFYFKTLNENLNPLSLDDKYKGHKTKCNKIEDDRKRLYILIFNQLGRN